MKGNFHELLDNSGKDFREQIQNAAEHVAEKLDKNVMKQLLLRVLEKGFLPVLEYPNPEFDNFRVRGLGTDNIGFLTPVPVVRLYNKQEYENRKHVVNDLDNLADGTPFEELLANMKEKLV